MFYSHKSTRWYARFFFLIVMILVQMVSFSTLNEAHGRGGFCKTGLSLPKSKGYYFTQERRYSKYSPKLPRSAEIAIERYIADSAVINKYLRKKDLENDIAINSPLVHNLDLILRILPTEPIDVPLYRVETRNENYISQLRPGQVITTDAYVSSSRNSEFFKLVHKYPYFGSGHNVRYVIEKNFSGKYISDYSPCRNREGPREIQEVLFPRGAQFKILKIDYSEEKPVIRMEEIEPEYKKMCDAKMIEDAVVKCKKVSEADFLPMYEDLF